MFFIPFADELLKTATGAAQNKLIAPHVTKPNSIVSSNLTIREYFAAMAMQGLITSVPTGTLSSKHGTEVAIQWADTLINELNK